MSTTMPGDSKTRYKTPFLLFALFWTILIVALAWWDYQQSHKAALSAALAASRMSYEKDLIYRRWASFHGGVYVPVGDHTPPNPYLARIPERDVTTPSGRKLTLLHPAFMMRQLYEFAQERVGSHVHLTSLTPIRPGNAPDEWEKNVLQGFERGETEVSSLQELHNETHMRLMRPLVTESGCLKCHAEQGYRVGGIAGGISVSVPWKPYQEALSAQVPVLILRYAGIWVMGILGLWVAFRQVEEHLSTQRRAEHALRESEERYRTLVDGSSDAIVVLSVDRKILSGNEGFFNLFGYAKEEAMGLPLWQLFPSAASFESFKGKAYPLIREAGSCRLEWEHVKKDGTTFVAELAVSVMKDNKGETFGYAAIIRDVSDRKRAEEEIQRVNADLNRAIERANELMVKAEQANVAKSEFLANMSHEIRTPMNGVIGMAGLLLDTDLDSRQRQYAEIVRASGEALLSVINDILDFSKIEARRLELEIMDFDLRATIEDTVEMLSVRAHEKGLELTCFVEPEVPSLLRGDPGRFRQIIVNLAGNGVKFTHEGDVVIRASLYAEDEHNVTVRVLVTDTGIGIPASRLGILFSPFTQVDGSTTRKYGGTGLGLAISKQLAEIMGGEIGVESREGEGSTFWFTAIFEKQPEGQVPATREHWDLEGVNVLVVDDNDTNRLLVTTLLRSWGCCSMEAPDGDTALVLLHDAARRGDPFEIALLDMAMPSMDGLELGRKIRASAELGQTSLIMMSSLEQSCDRAQLEKAGFSDYFSKPIRHAQLRASLARVMARKAQSPQEPARRVAARHAIAESAKRSIRILVAEDNIINQMVAVAMLEKLGYRADVVANGLEAVHALRKIPYDLVCMDAQMPEMDGFEATAVIRRLDSLVLNHDVPIIAMTAYAMKGDREKCIEAGMNDYLAKPIQAEQLAETLKRWLTKVPCGDQKPGPGTLSGQKSI